MTMRVRAGLMLMVAAMMVMAGCGHYNCGSGATFGGGCTASGGGISGGGGTGGGSSALALVYYVNNSQVGGLELSATGSTTTFGDIPNFVLPTLPTGYTNSAIVIAQKKFLYVPYASTSALPSLYAWSIDGTTGALAALAGSPFSVADVSGLASASQPPTPLITDPTGTFLYMADKAGSKIDVFQIDSSSGVPVLLFQTPTAISPWNLATDGLGKFLYVTEGNASGEGVQMDVFSMNSVTGALSGENTMPALNMWQVQGEPTGTYMVGIDGETGYAFDQKFDPNVYVFSIGANGVLTQQAKYPTPSGNGPTGVAVSPNGKFVYDFNISTTTAADGPMDGFSFAGGVLTPIANSPFTALTAPEGGFFDQSGAYLFFHASSAIGVFNIDPTTGTPSQPTPDVGVGAGAVIYPWAVTNP
jgi:DNA-binding beta-propeller fold protein YncE